MAISVNALRIILLVGILLMVLSFILNIVAFSSPTWLRFDTLEMESGLWRICDIQNGRNVDNCASWHGNRTSLRTGLQNVQLPTAMKTIQALQVVAMLCYIPAFLMSVIAFIVCVRGFLWFIIVGILGIFGSILIAASLGVFEGELSNPPATTSLSMIAVSAFGCVFLFIASLLLLIYGLQQMKRYKLKKGKWHDMKDAYNDIKQATNKAFDKNDDYFPDDNSDNYREPNKVHRSDRQLDYDQSHPTTNYNYETNQQQQQPQQLPSGGNQQKFIVLDNSGNPIGYTDLPNDAIPSAQPQQIQMIDTQQFQQNPSNMVIGYPPQ
ncbi:hypothetical protein SNEBB_011361 [Seison nebaliae]|nr:hypothetical protein SNEBB_011361 [Seison nebaliae]